jgi:tRNA(fMet)-specific endonuclease VapC
MARYLLDTNVVSEPLRVRPDENVLQHLRRFRSDCAIASVVWHELWFGCLQMPPSVRRNKIEYYLVETVKPSIPILPYDMEAATWHAEQRARLTTVGRTPPFLDGQIAAIAATQNLILVTFNEAHFIHFSHLQLENWRTTSQ